MWNWIKSMWNRALKAFKEFMAVALPTAAQIIMGELKDFAVEVVSSLDGTTLLNAEKREEAFNAIKEEAIRRGFSVSSSLIYTLVELAVQYLKSAVK